jgi:hypothetical protein
MLESEGKSFMPVMDWFIAQIKFYSGIDAFPFVVKAETNLEDLFIDLSTSYGTILYLDSKPITKAPENILFVRQQDIAKHFDL